MNRKTVVKNIRKEFQLSATHGELETAAAQGKTREFLQGLSDKAIKLSNEDPNKIPDRYNNTKRKSHKLPVLSTKRKK